MNCASLVNAAPQVTPVVAMAQVRKLVPHPAIGIAPPGGRSLVNIQTLLWVDAAADQSLGTVTLLGHRVGLRIHVQRVDWDFGDGQTETTAEPGRKYDPGDPCSTVTCRGYWGHVYTTTGAMTVFAQVTWSGEFRVGAGAWTPIAGAVTGPSVATGLTIRQARGVLVPDMVSH